MTLYTIAIMPYEDQPKLSTLQAMINDVSNSTVPFDLFPSKFAVVDAFLAIYLIYIGYVLVQEIYQLIKRPPALSQFFNPVGNFYYRATNYWIDSRMGISHVFHKRSKRIQLFHSYNADCIWRHCSIRCSIFGDSDPIFRRNDHHFPIFWYDWIQHILEFVAFHVQTHPWFVGDGFLTRITLPRSGQHTIHSLPRCGIHPTVEYGDCIALCTCSQVSANRQSQWYLQKLGIILLIECRLLPATRSYPGQSKKFRVRQVAGQEKSCVPESFDLQAFPFYLRDMDSATQTRTYLTVTKIIEHHLSSCTDEHCPDQTFVDECGCKWKLIAACNPSDPLDHRIVPDVSQLQQTSDLPPIHSWNRDLDRKGYYFKQYCEYIYVYKTVIHQACLME